MTSTKPQVIDFELSDGDTLFEVSTGKVWLVALNSIHHVADDTVYNSLFLPNIYHKNFYRIVDICISVGYPLCPGSCLVKFHGSDRIYILTAISGEPALLHILNPDVMKKYRLDVSLVRRLPFALLRNFKYIIRLV